MLNGGELSVAGGGSCSSVSVTSNNDIQNFESKNVESIPDIHFAIKAYPNPTASYFILKIESLDKKRPIHVRVLNMNGQEMEMRKNVAAGQTIQFGNSYLAGVYIVEVMQGEKKIMTKLIKQSH